MCSRRTSPVLLAALLSTACAGWQRLDEVAPDTLPRRQQVQVWSAGKARVLHAVRIDSDSISGVPFHLSPTCDSCRVTIPRATVDSLRMGDQETSAFLLIGAGLLIFAYLVSQLAHLGDGT